MIHRSRPGFFPLVSSSTRSGSPRALGALEQLLSAFVVALASLPRLVQKDGRHALIVDGEFEADRILNGDQTDWGLAFSRPTVLRVSLYTR